MAGDFNGLIIFSLIVCLTITQIPSVQSQKTASAQAPAPSADTCNGIYITYTYNTGRKIQPFLKNDPIHQPYRFESTLTVLNNGADDLKSWRAFVGFQHGEFLVSASNSVLADGTSLPVSVENGTVFAGFPQSDLKTGIETAGDLTQMEVQVDLVGTQFGVAPPDVPLPSNVTLVNDGFLCPSASKQGNTTMVVCCTKDPNVTSGITVDDQFLPRQSGDLTIMYDVIKAYESNYWAQVTISNHNPLGRLDYWKLSWDWMRDEFIYAMRGAYPSVVDTTDCIFGPQAQFYQALDFSVALNCQRRPTIVDLPPSKANDTNLGLVPFCCRNGTILPPSMDPSKSSSSFQVQVYKMPPDNNISQLVPPQNWQINGTLNPDYKCGPPVRVSPSELPDSNGLPTNTTAVASWQVICNITQQKNVSPKCCVSFSAYFNESIIPCKTCACGCPSNRGRTCSSTAPALFIPPEAQLVPFDNRTALALAWAELKHRTVPNPLPCSDNCGVTINWHLYTDYSRGWTARMTLFNWEEINFADWFVAVEMDKAGPGFQKAYSFNGTLLDGVNNTIFMQGLPGLNYLIGETNVSANSPLVPGKQQSVISFSKKTTPGINVADGDGFPVKVYFNGDECSLPGIFPTSSSHSSRPVMLISFLLAVVVLMWVEH
ncbi:hypothetical protein Nepgr_021746 [Nepenthes gracilis]|uniref:COBRA C-terminal domain-containing protein n=1 Tax=Nepenthes gracilis TaxID=150966 RepID=A0AAD3XXH9_NEPGR|nr:hypothetical protein Nepgr_021746 [Nepenthes gracilis]